MKLMLEKIGELRVLDASLEFNNVTNELTVEITGVGNDNTAKSLSKTVTLPATPDFQEGIQIVYPEPYQPFASYAALLAFSGSKRPGDLAIVVADSTQAAVWDLYVWDNDAWSKLLYVPKASNTDLGLVKGTGYSGEVPAQDMDTLNNICSIDLDGRVRVPKPSVGGSSENFILSTPPYGIKVGETTNSPGGTLQLLQPWSLYLTRAELTGTAGGILIGIRLWFKAVQPFASAVQTGNISNSIPRALWSNLPLNSILAGTGIQLPMTSTLYMRGSACLLREYGDNYAHNRAINADCILTCAEAGQDNFSFDAMLQTVRVITGSGSAGGAYNEWEQNHNMPDFQIMVESFGL
jgi:hypothetical protein